MGSQRLVMNLFVYVWSYLGPLQPLAAHFFNQLKHLFLGLSLGEGENFLVECLWIADDSSHIFSNITHICECNRNVSASEYSVIRCQQSIIEATRRHPGKGDLVPPAHINHCVRKIKTFDMIEDIFLLLKWSANFGPLPNKTLCTHRVAQVHDSSRCNRGKETWHVSFDSSCFCSNGQRDLVRKRLVVNGRNNHIDPFQDVDELILRTLKVG